MQLRIPYHFIAMISVLGMLLLSNVAFGEEAKAPPAAGAETPKAEAPTAAPAAPAAAAPAPKLPPK